MSHSSPFLCTAIVATVDRPQMLEACLRSLAAASPAFAEVIVADQGATRALEPLVTALGATYLHLDRRGLSRARNAALGLARSPWLYFPDDDCTVTPSVLDQVARALARHPQAGFVAARILTPSGRAVMAGMDQRERVLDAPRDILGTVMSPGLFVSERVFARCGRFDESFGLGAEWPSGEESDFLFRALAAGEIGVYAPAAVVQHPDPYVVRDAAESRSRARLYGRGWGAMFAKHAGGTQGRAYAALQRRYELRALAGALVSALTLRFDRTARQLESWRGRREGWRGWSAVHREHR
jgi:GT2 family glycosyltransferase